MSEGKKMSEEIVGEMFFGNIRIQSQITLRTSQFLSSLSITNTILSTVSLNKDKLKRHSEIGQLVVLRQGSAGREILAAHFGLAL